MAETDRDTPRRFAVLIPRRGPAGRHLSLGIASTVATCGISYCRPPYREPVPGRYRESVASLRDRVVHSEPPRGGLQLHELESAPVTYACPRCGWHGNVWKVATVNGDWTAPVCERCYEDLHPDIPAVVSYWSVSQPAYQATTPQEHMPFTVIRSRAVAGRLASRDEIYRPHFSQDGDVWEFTSALVEEARDGSSYDLAEISQNEACAIMERARARYFPG
jgi:hypothetical protein